MAYDRQGGFDVFRSVCVGRGSCRGVRGGGLKPGAAPGVTPTGKQRSPTGGLMIFSVLADDANFSARGSEREGVVVNILSYGPNSRTRTAEGTKRRGSSWGGCVREGVAPPVDRVWRYHLPPRKF